MAWVRFTHDYNFAATPAVTIAYKTGMVMNVPSPAAVQAIAAGKAVRMRKENKDSEPVEVSESEIDECRTAPQEPAASNIYSTSSAEEMAPMATAAQSPEPDHSLPSSSAQPV